MELKTPLDHLLIVLTLLTGVCPIQPQEIYVLEGEMVVLQCPYYTGHNPNNDTKLIWSSYTVKEKYVTYDMSSAEQRQMVIRGTSLVILTASINHQGNYSCTLGNTSSQFWFRLTVNTAHSTENEARAKYSITCNAQEQCMLNCPDVNTPNAKTLKLTRIEWHKEGETLPKKFFSSVGEEHQGYYTCTRSYWYHGKIYNMTFTVLLEVKPKGKSGLPQILSPNNNDVFYVDMGSTVVINCEAVVYSVFDEVFWISGTSFVETNDSYPVFYNSTREDNIEEIKMTASLIFKKVSQGDLSKYYICKMESAAVASSFINITLAQKAHPFPVALSIVCILLMMLVVVVVVVCMQFKTSICLFLRDTLGFNSSTSDRSHTDAGLEEDRRQCLSPSFTIIITIIIPSVFTRLGKCTTVIKQNCIWKLEDVFEDAAEGPALVQQAMRMARARLFPLLFLLTPLAGLCLQTHKEIIIQAGETVELHCPQLNPDDDDDTKVVWTSYTPREMDLTSDMSSAEQTQLGVRVLGRNLVILSASEKQQNYSCSLRNTSSQFWFRLMVNMTKYLQTCYAEESCKLECPANNTTVLTNTTMITWKKDGKSLQGFFRSVSEEDQGVYTCIRSYLDHGHIYNRSYTVVLNVEPKEPLKTAVIISPRDNDAFQVDLGSVVVIDCKAIVYSLFDEVFWLNGTSFVETNNNFSVFYNSTRKEHNGEIKMTASLVFKKVSEEDLSRNYTCKLESQAQVPSFVNITLTQKAQPSYVSLAPVIVSIVLVMIVTVVIYVKFKIDISLFLRDTLGCHRSPSDGKSYDAFLLCYSSNTDAGLNDQDRKWLEGVLEAFYGYSLCLYDRDVLPGGAETEAVLDCIEKSRAVVLVPTSPDSGPGSALLSAIHATLVERQSHLIFIKTETTKAPTSGSLPEALQFLSEAGDCVTWKGISSMTSSSCFFKHLRYYLPAPQDASKMQLLPQTVQDIKPW
ncbi:interleukin-1 receptor type 1-like [Channa argus]